jgi:hypothetical protein
VTGSVANDDRAGATFNSRGVEPLDHRGIAAAGVLGHIHNFEAKRHGKLHRLLCSLKQEVFRPVFGIATEGTGSDKCGGLYLQAGSLHDFRNRTNVVFVGAGGAVGLNIHPAACNFAGQYRYMLRRARSSARKTEVERVDSQRLH